MNLKSLYNKTKDTVKLVLTQPTMIFRNIVGAEIVAEHIVRDDDVVRPDRIALLYYGDHSKLDMILKFNNISDPFSLMPGETIFVPSPTTAYYKLERPGTYEENIVKQQFIDTKRLSKKDQRRVEALKKKYNKETLLPPNVIPVGKKNYEFDGSEVRMGAQVQTDAVVESITAELIAAANAEGIEVVTETTTVDVDIPAGGTGILISSSGSGSGVGAGLTGTQLDKLLNENSGVKGTSSGTGAGGAGKTDTADQVGGNKGDGTAPAGSNNSTDSGSAEGPCNK
jgi:hypothetical protein